MVLFNPSFLPFEVYSDFAWGRSLKIVTLMLPVTLQKTAVTNIFCVVLDEPVFSCVVSSMHFKLS